MQTYTDTLHATQRESSLTVTMLQDITTFDGQDSSKLEDWFMDIETAAGILAESHTCLAEDKSCGLPCMLICEGTQIGKCWDEIKGMLRLKKNAMQITILIPHTSWRYNRRIMKLLLPISITSKQNQNQTKPKQCDFGNDTAAIHIFVRGLWDVHTIAAKQLTAMLTLPSSL